ncbi:hypothetical protein Tco_0785402 [Tanacetum coccineum]
MLTKEIGRSFRIDDEVVQYQRQRDDNDLQDKRQDQPKEEEVIFSHQIEMESIIPLGQKNTLAEYMILFSGDNRPPMLDKDLYDSWKSRMELYMQNREHGIMILESVENGPLIWPTVEDN